MEWNDAKWELAERKRQDRWDAEQAAAEAKRKSDADELYEAAITNIDLTVHGNMTSVWNLGQGYISKGRAEAVWETLRGCLDYEDFDKRLIQFFVSSAKAGNEDAQKLLSAVCDKYAEMRME